MVQGVCHFKKSRSLCVNIASLCRLDALYFAVNTKYSFCANHLNRIIRFVSNLCFRRALKAWNIGSIPLMLTPLCVFMTLANYLNEDQSIHKEASPRLRAQDRWRNLTRKTPYLSLCEGLYLLFIFPSHPWICTVGQCAQSAVRSASHYGRTLRHE